LEAVVVASEGGAVGEARERVVAAEAMGLAVRVAWEEAVERRWSTHRYECRHTASQVA